MSQSNLNLANKAAGPVECLGQKFPTEEARREHFLKLLAQKLKDPEFRKIEGFPIGKDEDILALSDPPYYTACPNPWLGEFIKAYGITYDPKLTYHREPFAADVGEGKYHPLYKLHPYPTKVPHRAIMKYILHYTQPGDIVFDGFCGTGMTGVAARLSGDRTEVEALGYRVARSGVIADSEGQPLGQLGARVGLVGDLSPSATFISYSANNTGHGTSFEKAARNALRIVEAEHDWMFTTIHGAQDKQVFQLAREIAKSKDSTTCRELILKYSAQGLFGRVNYAVWSDVFTCPECGTEIIYWKSCVNRATGKVLESFDCPECKAALTKRDLHRVNETVYDTSLGKTITWAKQELVRILISP